MPSKCSRFFSLTVSPAIHAVFFSYKAYFLHAASRFPPGGLQNPVMARKRGPALYYGIMTGFDFVGKTSSSSSGGGGGGDGAAFLTLLIMPYSIKPFVKAWCMRSMHQASRKVL